MRVIESEGIIKVSHELATGLEGISTGDLFAATKAVRRPPALNLGFTAVEAIEFTKDATGLRPEPGLYQFSLHLQHVYQIDVCEANKGPQ